MTVLRSFIFNIGFFVGTFVLTIIFLPVLLWDRDILPRCGRVWAYLVRVWLGVTVGIRVEVRGEVPTGPCLIAAKHQSAWETIELLHLLPDACFVLKKELTWIPIFGWYIYRNRQIVIDRSAGIGALKHMVVATQIALDAGRQIVVFPQGTRVKPDAKRAYQSGIGSLYKHLSVTVIPVALNSGLFWGRNKFIKYPGTIVIEFLSPMPENLEPRAFVEKLSATIEEASSRLVAEGRQNTKVCSTKAKGVERN